MSWFILFYALCGTAIGWVFYKTLVKLGTPPKHAIIGVVFFYSFHTAMLFFLDYKFDLQLWEIGKW